MKKFVAAFVSLLVSVLASSVVESHSGPALMGGPSGTATVQVIPVLGPAMNMASSWEAMKTLAEDYYAGTLGAGGGGYTTVTNGKIGWQHLVYAEGVATGWPVVQQMIVAGSEDGGDSISLSDITVETVSTAGALNDRYTFASLGYSEAAVGRKSDGSFVRSGPGNQKVATVMVVTQMRLFNGGATQAGLDGVRNWVLSQNNFTMVFKAMVGVNVGEARVSLSGFSNTQPRLIMTDVGVRLEGEPGRSYQLLSSVSIMGPWQHVATMSTGQTWSVEKSGSSRFYTAVAH